MLLCKQVKKNKKLCRLGCQPLAAFICFTLHISYHTFFTYSLQIPPLSASPSSSISHSSRVERFNWISRSQSHSHKNRSFTGRNARIGVSPSQATVIQLKWQNQNIIRKADMQAVHADVPRVSSWNEKNMPRLAGMRLTDKSHGLLRLWHCGTVAFSEAQKSHINMFTVLITCGTLFSWAHCCTYFTSYHALAQNGFIFKDPPSILTRICAKFVTIKCFHIPPLKRKMSVLFPKVGLNKSSMKCWVCISRNLMVQLWYGCRKVNSKPWSWY